MTLTYGVAALARPTFDVAFAEETKNRAFAALDNAGIRTVGPRDLLFDGEAAEAAIAQIRDSGPVDLLLILQVTFTDAGMTVDLVRGFDGPVAVWALPEPRIGGRLRLNAFCGLNLAAHAMGKHGLSHAWLWTDPDDPDIGERLSALAAPVPVSEGAATPAEAVENVPAERVVESLAKTHIRVIGEHPDGFDTCEYDAEELRRLAGVTVDAMPIDDLFARAVAIDAGRAAGHRNSVGETLAGVDDVNQEELDKSMRLYCALEDIRDETNADGLAVRCWPETFTDYGCASCGPMAMMNERRVPSACEADVYGSVSALMLQELADEPAWMADLVDIDASDDTAVLWHCGLAPLSMCDPEFKPEATIHTNRKKPLLHQFPLKPGRVTLCRLSQARNRTQLMIGGAEVLRAPMAFTGTSGVLRFDKPASEVCETIMREALEHHYALAYGDHRDALRAVAAKLSLPVLELT